MEEEILSILESTGVEIISVMSPVSICMFIVVLLVYTLTTAAAQESSVPLRTAANLVYLENPTDTVTEKLQGSLLNALVLVLIIALVTFLIVLLYYYNFTNFLKNYTRLSTFFVLAFLGGSIAMSVVNRFMIPIDAVTFFVAMFNFTVVGVMSVFSGGMPIIVRQGYMICLGIITAVWFTKSPEWTTWTLLVALALYDLVAVLAPGGPLKMLVELASTRGEDLPALVYEARPTARSPRMGSILSMLVFMASADRNTERSVELQAVNADRNTGFAVIEVDGDNNNNREMQIENEGFGDEGETLPLVPRNSNGMSSRHGSIGESSDIVVANEEMSPLVGTSSRTENLEDQKEITRGIKLGLGDFIFYSVLVGRAAMYDLMTVYACYLAIISGLGCTLILLSVCRKALPALPISITLGIMFYFLTRLLMEPFVVGISINLMMF